MTTPLGGSPITTLGGDYAIHLTFLQEGVGWRIACMPHVSDFKTAAHHPNYLRSDDTRAVTCPRCKKTDEFARVRATGR